MRCKMREKWICGWIILVSVLVFVPSAFAGKVSIYTKYNIHVQEKLTRNGEHVYNASYANYTNPGTGHLIIPAGTEITILKKKSKGFSFRVEKDSKVVDFDFHKPRMGMSVDEYLEKITSPKPVSLNGLSKIDKKGVAEGKAFVGMTRDGVMAALGYPATHRTPTLDSKTWVYWTNRFKTCAVNFNEQGKVDSTKN